MCEKNCIVCGSVIYTAASKCIHCKSYQDWRRHLNFSQSTLALIIALLSIMTVAGPVLKNLFAADESNVKASYLICKPGRFEVVLTNSGNRTAVVRGGNFQLLLNGKTHLQEHVTALPIDGLKKSPFVAPGQSRLFKMMRNNTENFPVNSSANQTCRYKLGLEIIGFDHKPRSPIIECDCQ